MPLELRAQAEQAAKNAGRSMNAELIARIEKSFLGNGPQEELIPAKRAKELALMAREGIPGEIRRRVIEAIERAIRLGHSQTSAGLGDLQLDSGIPDSELNELQSNIVSELENAGYKVDWDDITSIWIEF
jgi:acetylglutamate kinase